jgi:hypothetical protein
MNRITKSICEKDNLFLDYYFIIIVPLFIYDVIDQNFGQIDSHL